MKRIVYILLLALLLTACGKEKTQEPTVTTDPTTAPTTATAMAEVDKFQKFIKDNWWYWRALGCTFEKPEDISAEYFFYMGLSAEDEKNFNTTITSEEQAALDDIYRQEKGKDPPTAGGAIKLPVEGMNKALSILDVTVEDIKIPSHWLYYDKTDAYYFWVSDAYGVVGWKVTEVEKDTNGIVKVYWETSQSHWNTATEEFYLNGVKMVMTLQEKPDGSYLVLSNLPVEPVGPVTADDFTQFFKDEYWYKRALGCTFEKPEDISLRFYFYTGIGEHGHNDYKYFTSEEQAFLAKAYKDKYGREEYTMATRLPVKKIEKALSILGVTLEDVEIPESWVYYDQTDAYYFWVSDAYGADPWKVTKVENGANGIVKVYWEGPQRHLNTATGKFYREDYPRMVMTLQKKPDGRIFVLSNLPVNNTR